MLKEIQQLGSWVGLCFVYATHDEMYTIIKRLCNTYGYKVQKRRIYLIIDIFAKNI